MLKLISVPSGPQCSVFFNNLSEKLLGQTRRKRPFYRICELMRKNNVRTLAIHANINRKDGFERKYPHLSEYLRDISPQASIRNVTQVSFLRCEHNSIKQDDFPKKIANRDVLGCAVIISLQLNEALGVLKAAELLTFVYKAVVPFTEKRRRVSNPWDIISSHSHIFSGIEFYIPGASNLEDGKTVSCIASYFCQNDNGLQAVCSQVALRMILFHALPRNTKMLSYKKMNRIVNDSRTSRQKTKFKPSEGYEIDDIREFLASQNLSMLKFDYKNKKTSSFSPFEFAHLLIESGIPTLIAFSPTQRTDSRLHIVPVIGHTTNYDKWSPIAHSVYDNYDGLRIYDTGVSYVASSAWIPDLIVQDDVLGPYYCLAQRDLLEIVSKYDKPSMRLRIRYVIGVVPQAAKFNISPYIAQILAAYCFRRNWDLYVNHILAPWQERFKYSAFFESDRNLVFRTQLISANDYLGHIRRSGDETRQNSSMSSYTYTKLLQELPDKFWMAEFSCPDLYGVTRSKFGEVLVKFNPTPSEIEDFKSGTVDNSPIFVGLRFLNKIFLRGLHTEFMINIKNPTGIFIRQKTALRWPI